MTKFIMRKVALAPLMLLLAAPSHGAAPEPSFSLLFRPQEVDMIREMREGGGDIGVYNGASNLLKHLYLSALIYVSETNWSLWINGQVVRPENTLQLDPFTLLSVTPTGAQFAWHGGGRPQTFTLNINQTFDAATGAVLSGDGRPGERPGETHPTDGGAVLP